MNRSSAWFARYYPGSAVTRIMVIPPRKLAPSAALTDEVLLMGQKDLKLLTSNVLAFFNEYRTVDLRDLSEQKINLYLDAHQLTVDDLATRYGQKPKAHKGR